MPPNFCCTHPHRALSPTEPARPALFNLDGIFAVAALPDDHPHALRLPDRKPPSSLAKSLIRSPSIAAKLKSQLRRRRTLRNLRGAEADVRSLRAEVYDEDARSIGSCEMREYGGGRVSRASAEPPVLRLRRLSPLNSSPDLRRLEGFSPGSARKVRSSLELRRKEGSSRRSDDSAVDLQAFININFGSPPVVVSDLASHQLDGSVAPGPLAADIDIQPSTSGSLEDAVLHAADKVQLEEEERPATSTSLHLNSMNISQQLRSMSQMSESMDKTDRLTPEAWTFHRRERSNAGLTASGDVESERARHGRQISVSGVDSAYISATWGRLNRERDTSSSVYSRPTSPEAVALRAISTEIADWPLAEDEQINPAATGNDGTFDEAIELQDLAPARATPVAPQATPPPSITLSVPHSQSASHLAPPERAASQKSGSSTFTKRSKFLERFSPPSKLVKKRRSIFKFLRPGSRRQQPRSISTPVLRSTPGRTDGAADDGELLTVQYELTQPQDGIRSMSLNNLPSIAVSNDDEERDVSTELRPRPSLADYERKLSIMGDDRRRPSAVNLRRLSQIQEDDRHDSVAASKSFSRGSRTKDTDPLMEAALERQLAEKALFRSSSRRSGPVTPTEPSAPSFVATTWGEPAVSIPQSAERDPLDPVASSSADKKVTETHLFPPRTPLGGRSRASTVTMKPIRLETPSSASQTSSKSKIASPLSSWARFPSHNRIERCASAGPEDNVITRDFAFETKHGNSKESTSPDGKRTWTGAFIKRSKHHLPKSRSATFSTLTRNLSSIFSGAEYYAKGRRTSVAVGGRLEYPELEVLPPIMPSSAHSQPSLRRSSHVVDLLENEFKNAIHPAHRDEYQNSEDRVTENIPFRHASVFQETGQDRRRIFSMVDPAEGRIESTDEENGGVSLLSDQQRARPSDSTHSHHPNFDGAADPAQSSLPSKAELWSGVYQDCINRPSSANLVRETNVNTKDADTQLMPPPTLKLSKRRSLEPQSKHLDPGATVRRFPSVTVVDDRKGHWRSVSFISVQSGKSARSGMSGASFVRDSSNDLLKLMRTKEQEEREKLMSGEVEMLSELMA